MPQKRVGHEKALKRDPQGPYAQGFKARKGTPPPMSPSPDTQWMRREFRAGQAAKGKRKR